MSWEDQYAEKLSEIKRLADSGQLREDNQILQEMQRKGKNIPALGEKVRKIEVKAK